jgi:regulator of replication initiation timing
MVKVSEGNRMSSLDTGSLSLREEASTDDETGAEKSSPAPTVDDVDNDDHLSAEINNLFSKSRQQLREAQKMLDCFSEEVKEEEPIRENDHNSGDGVETASRTDFQTRFNDVVEKATAAGKNDQPDRPLQLELQGSSDMIKTLQAEIKSLNEQSLFTKQQHEKATLQKLADESKERETKVQEELDALRIEHKVVQDEAAEEIKRLKLALEHGKNGHESSDEEDGSDDDDDDDDSSSLALEHGKNGHESSDEEDGSDDDDDDSSSSSSSTVIDILPTITEEPDRSSLMSEPGVRELHEPIMSQIHFEEMIEQLTEEVEKFQDLTSTLEEDKKRLESENERLKQELEKSMSGSSHSRRKQKTRSKKTSPKATDSDYDEVVLKQFDELFTKLSVVEPFEAGQSLESEDVQVRAIAEAQKRRSSWLRF